MMKNALVLEDHPEARQVLIDSLQQALPHITTIHQATTLQQAREHIKNTHYDLAIIDISLPDGLGLDFISEIKSKCVNCYIVMATIHDRNEYILKALRAGAKGYLLKDQPQAVIIEALQGIAEGKPPLTSTVTNTILDYFHLEDEPTQDQLTNREREVLTLLAKGCSRKDIANQLELSAYTIAGFTKQIYKKLGVHSSVQASLEAARMGLIHIE